MASRYGDIHFVPSLRRSLPPGSFDMYSPHDRNVALVEYRPSMNDPILDVSSNCGSPRSLTAQDNATIPTFLYRFERVTCALTSYLWRSDEGLDLTYLKSLADEKMHVPYVSCSTNEGKAGLEKGTNSRNLQEQKSPQSFSGAINILTTSQPIDRGGLHQNEKL